MYTPVEALIEPPPVTLHTGVGQDVVKLCAPPATTAGGVVSEVIVQVVAHSEADSRQREVPLRKKGERVAK